MKVRRAAAFLLAAPFATAVAAPAATLQASSLAELQGHIAAAKPGDRVVLKDGPYATERALEVRGRHGTAEAPIVIEAESRLGATIGGGAGFVFEESSYITIQGFRFTHAETQRVPTTAHHIRFTRNLFELAPRALHWMQVLGDDVEIDHNVFQNKKTAGVYVAVTGRGGDPATTMAQRTHIHHNGFYDHAFPGRNGGEGIRIGLSGLALLSAHAVIEHNLFERHDGDPEAVSVKSSDNAVRFNTVRDSKGGLVLRHGNRTTVEGNILLNGRGGIRFYGDDHRIINNYVAGGTGESPQEPGWGAAITIGSGSVEDHLPEHDAGSRRGRDAPERVLVAFNTIVDHAQPVAGEDREFGPRDCVIANNVIQGARGPLVDLPADGAAGFRWDGNIVWGAEVVGDVPESGYRRVDPKLVLRDGLFRPEAKSPLIDAAVGAHADVARDIDGQEREGAKDVGADEASAGDTVRRPLTRADVGPDAP